MIILAIDTAVDDTSVAILAIRNRKLEILSNIISSQVKVHEKWGGIVPTLAKREHQKNLPLVFEKSLKKTKNPKIDLIGVTVGPGLEPCLWQGVNFAKALSDTLRKPVIPVNHIEAHILANFLSLSEKIKNEKLKIKSYFPAVCLVVSGGNTQLILMREIGNYKLLGETRDDAAGECFDKTARILGLGYPGGPAIAELARQWKSQIPNPKFQICLPRPMIHQKNYDFSFSGLKTAVLYDFKSRSSKIRKSKQYIQEMCFEIQQAIVDVLIKKTIKAARDFRVKSIILGGGVAANDELRKQFNYKLKTVNYKLKFLVPPKISCTDNAAMIGATSYFHWLRGKKKNWQEITVDANLKIENRK